MNETISVDQLSLAFTCRTCLKTDSGQQLVPIFDGHQPKNGAKCPFDLFQQLQFLKLKIAPNDGLPASICSRCMDRLAAVDDFRTQCEKAQEFLDRYFVGLSSGGEGNVEQYTDLEQLEEPAEEVGEQDDDLYCSVCGKGYKRRAHLERHLLKHTGGDEETTEPVAPSTSYVCLKCGKRFMKVETLIQHKTDGKCVSAEQPACRFCFERFSSEQQLEAHLEHAHPKDRPHACPLCKKTFQSVSNRNTHLLLHNAEGSVKCNECELSFRSKVYLRRHVKTVHTVTHHECGQCEATFTSTVKYAYHLKSHDPNKKYQCRDCPKSFLQQHHLANHERNHSGTKPFLCNVCGKRFMHEPSFKVHLKIHAAIREHVCAICAKSFVQRSTYAAHLKTHNTVQPVEPTPEEVQLKLETSTTTTTIKSLRFTCQLCNKVFKLPSSLESHMKIHREERNHVCGECGNCFKRAEHLRVHINGVHLKRKPYSCEVCHKTFAQSGDRNVHMRRHNSDDRPFKCSYCEKSFSLAKALRSHVRLHTGEKPFACAICKMSFISYSALAAHTLKHQEEELNRTELHTLEGGNLANK